MGRPGASRVESSFRTRPTAARGIAALAAAAILLSGCAGPAPSRAPVPDTTPYPSGTAAPSADPASSLAPGAPGAAERWATIAVADQPAPAELVPTQAGPGGVASTTAFTLTSLDGTAPAELAARLRVEPPVTLAVASVAGNTAILRPAAPLLPRTLYRISLLREDGTTAAGWAAQTAGPLHVVETVPGDSATAVPVDTGIEIRFDQSGVSTADLEKHLVISPRTAGRLEAAGRAIAFVPTAPLRTGTLYTFTITRGLPISGTDERLESDAVVRFETASTSISKVHVGFRRSFVESGTGDRPTLGLWVDIPGEDGDLAASKDYPSTLPVTVHRLAGLRAAENAWIAISDAPTWTVASTTPAVATKGLPRVINATIRLSGERWGPWITLPRRLGAGWYVVTTTIGGVPRQALLQVTDLATYTLAGKDRTAVWVNDLGTTDAVRGATVTIGGTRIGTTDRQGLVLARTPASLAGMGEGSAKHLFLVVGSGGRSAFQPLSASTVCAACGEGTGNDAWWQLLTSDRSRYRSTDTVNAWGVVRDRASGAVPRTVTVRLIAGPSPDQPDFPISTTHATPDRSGAYAVSVPLRDLPAGAYRLLVDAGNATVSELWFEVGAITKPAYRLALALEHRAAHEGDMVSTTIHGSFFEGTPVAGTSIRAAADDNESGATTTTNAQGDASAAVRVAVPDQEQWGIVTLRVTPQLPEEADIFATANVAVFRGSALVDAQGTAVKRRLTITGKVSDVVLGRFDAPAVQNPWEVDPRGAGRPGASVSVRVIEHYAVRRQVGTTYDWILKRVTPRYDYTEKQRAVATRTVTTAKDGTFRLVLDVVKADRSYEIVATYTDEGGHRLVQTTSAEGAQLRMEDAWPRLVGPKGVEGEGEYSVGGTVTVRFTDGIARPKADRYLFAVTQRGLRSVTLSGSPVFSTPFRASSVPGIAVRGVRFNGYGYEATGSYAANLRLADRRLAVTVTADKDRYAPGDHAVLTVRTLDPSGRPVAASAFVQVVDEKLFASGDAGASDPITALYAGLGDGIVLALASHSSGDDTGGGKGGTGGGGGDTTGGGRSDFRDWLLGRLISTDATGTGTVEVPLSDDLTSWRATAAAVDGRLQAGSGEASLAVTLPFFAEATVATEYLVADHPIIRVRGFGAGLAAGTPVTFTVSSDTLPMAPVTATAPAFGAAEIPLAGLSAGTHTLRIEASAQSATGPVRDTLVRTFRVVESRLTRLTTTWSALTAPTPVAAGSETTRLQLVDAGRGRVIPILEDLAWSGGPRADMRLAADTANRVLADAFALEPAEPIDDAALNPFIVGDGWLGLLVYGSPDLDVTALAALSGDPRLNTAATAEALRQVAYNTSETRDRRLLALVGLAGLGETVLPDVRAAAALTDLTVTEQISLALAALAAGDEALARSLERAVLARHGLHLGPWTRVDPGADADAAVQTARLAIVAASLGDPVAAEMDAWVAANSSRTTSIALERALAARGWAARVPASPASAAITVDGTRREVVVGDGKVVEITLTPAQAASATVEPVTGSVLVITSRTAPLDPASLTPAKGQVLERSVSPAGRIGEADTVTVTLRVTLGPDARDDCWRVVDLAPSGLAPILPGNRLEAASDGARPSGGLPPDAVQGQRVEFCVVRNPKQPVQTLRYVARVVNPGTYAWEPALLQSWTVPDQGLLTPAGSVLIAGAGG